MPFSRALQIDHIDLLCDELVDFSEHRIEDLVKSASKQFSQPDGLSELRNHVRTLSTWCSLTWFFSMDCPWDSPWGNWYIGPHHHETGRQVWYSHQTVSWLVGIHLYPSDQCMRARQRYSSPIPRIACSAWESRQDHLDRQLWVSSSTRQSMILTSRSHQLSKLQRRKVSDLIGDKVDSPSASITYHDCVSNLWSDVLDQGLQ